MNEKREPWRGKDMQESIWREICSYKAERQVGETVARPSTSGCSKCPSQAAENRKIMGVSVWGRSALFSAGNGLVEMGNTLVHLKHGARAVAGHV